MIWKLRPGPKHPDLSLCCACKVGCGSAEACGSDLFLVAYNSSDQPLHVDAAAIIKGERAPYLASLGCSAGGLHQL